jgi:ATPase subunit of ABC transporter with duplicated ATPase domains
MMPTLGFNPDRDNDRLVASFSGGWQMRIGLGKILLQEPDLLLLVRAIMQKLVAWLVAHTQPAGRADKPPGCGGHRVAGAVPEEPGGACRGWYTLSLALLTLLRQQVPMVIVSHDREFLDQLCTKIVEVERGVVRAALRRVRCLALTHFPPQATTYPGSYSDYARQKSTAIAVAMSAWEKQQKEIDRQTELILRLSGTGQAGRAEAAKKALEKIKSEEEVLEKPWVEKRRPFRFPEPPRSGRIVVRVDGLVHGYGNKRLIKDANLLVERGERIALVVRRARAGCCLVGLR